MKQGRVSSATACPRCGNALVEEVRCPLCAWDALVEAWLPRIREAMQYSLYHCARGRIGQKRWLVSAELIDAASWRWEIKVEEVIGRVLVSTTRYASLKRALEHHPGLTSVTGWQPLERLRDPLAFPFPERVFGLEE